jgi:hypothetical protein
MRDSKEEVVLLLVLGKMPAAGISLSPAKQGRHMLMTATTLDFKSEIQELLKAAIFNIGL